MIRKAIFLVPRVVITAACAAFVFGVAAPLFWVRDRIRGEM